MVTAKSLDVYRKIIIAALSSAQALHGEIFSIRALRLTIKKCESRLHAEGIGFLTKSMSRLAKCLDQALASDHRLDVSQSGFAAIPGTNLPRFLGELFSAVFNKDGTISSNPDATCVRTLRQILGLFYKLELAYSDEQKQATIDSFFSSESELVAMDDRFTQTYEIIQKAHTSMAQSHLGSGFGCGVLPVRSLSDHFAARESSRMVDGNDVVSIASGARRALAALFRSFDGSNITPRHGPGAVAEKQQHSAKFKWSRVSQRITDRYPLDAYFYASCGAVCDSYKEMDTISSKDSPARVVLVPKDSRGPRLISCEPVDYQWIQQGMLRAIVHHVESHSLTKGFVNFTDQEVNRNLALKASIAGDDVTLDLKEASDRVHTGLVQLIFPEELFSYLISMRSSSTVLPDGSELELRKFAPMGSAICFPVLALTIWSLLYSAAPDAYVRNHIFVYGDDVIVPREFSERAMTTLELFGLKINRHKSCTQGLFRESCGMDAFKGSNVTPVRLRTVWSESPAAGHYSSWIAYANSFYDNGFKHVHEVIRDELRAIYGPIPERCDDKSYPSLALSLSSRFDFRTRWNRALQKVQTRVRVIVPKKTVQHMPGWSKLLRFFTESGSSSSHSVSNTSLQGGFYPTPLDTSQYTLRRAVKLAWRWQ